MKEVFWAILKILGFLIILPLIIASVIALQNQVLSLPVKKEAWILWGAGSYTAFNLFVYNGKEVFDFGKTTLEKIFTYFQPAGYIVPVYAVLLIMAYVVTLILGKGAAWQAYFFFFIAFTLTMHLVLTAHDIYNADNSVLKAHYLLTFGVVLIVNIIVMSLLLAWAIPEYSLVGFLKSLVYQTSHLYATIYKALFVDSNSFIR